MMCDVEQRPVHSVHVAVTNCYYDTDVDTRVGDVTNAHFPRRTGDGNENGNE